MQYFLEHPLLQLQPAATFSCARRVSRSQSHQGRGYLPGVRANHIRAGGIVWMASISSCTRALDYSMPT
eukprot:820990-Prorocentrum_minimum.AAC.1